MCWHADHRTGIRKFDDKSHILTFLGVILDPKAKIILQNGDVDFDVDNFVVATETDWYAAVTIPKVGLMPNGDFDIPVDSEFFELASGNSLSKTGIAFSQKSSFVIKFIWHIISYILDFTIEKAWIRWMEYDWWRIKRRQSSNCIFGWFNQVCSTV